MIYTKEKLEKRILYYYKEDFDPWNLNEYIAAYDELEANIIKTPRELLSLLYRASELLSIPLQTFNRLYYESLKNITDSEARQKLEKFQSEIYAYVSERNNKVLRLYYDHPLRQQVNQDSFRKLNQSLEAIFASQNDANTELQNRELQLVGLYREYCNQLSFSYGEKDYLFKDTAALLSSENAMQRAAVWAARKDAFETHKGKLHDMFGELVSIRCKMASNAGFEHYYDFIEASRDHDFLPRKELQNAIQNLKKHLHPLMTFIHRRWQKDLGVRRLAPCDCEQSPDLQYFKPFKDVNELISKAIHILYDIRFEYGLLLNKMWNSGLLDLEHDSQKAGGQFYFGDVQYGSCNIMMNCTGSHNDLMMFFHELGHVLQFSALMKSPLFSFTSVPNQLREIASQTMVYLSSTAWEDFYPDPKILAKAIRFQYISDVLLLVKGCLLAEFQMEIYAHPEWDAYDREEEYKKLCFQYHPCFSLDDADAFSNANWLMDMTVYEFPYYDTHTSFSLIAVWELMKHYAKAKEDTMIRFQSFLNKTTENSVQELFDVLGVKSDFSEAHIRKVLDGIFKIIK